VSQFVKIHDVLVNTSLIRSIDLRPMDGSSRAVVQVDYFPGYKSSDVVAGIEAIDLIMTLKPSALEGRRFKWIRHAWLIHNLVGHPMMQVFALLGKYDWAMRVHEATVPRPL